MAKGQKPKDDVNKHVNGVPVKPDTKDDLSYVDKGWDFVKQGDTK